MNRNFKTGFFAAAAGIMVALIGIAAIIGHLLDASFLSNGDVEMALSTGICFVVVGTALIVIGGNLLFKK